MKTRNAVTHYKYIIYYSTTHANNTNYCVIALFMVTFAHLHHNKIQHVGEAISL